mgnify:CR=1 FL=1
MTNRALKQIACGLALAAAAVVALVFTGMEGKGIYSKPVDELVKAQGAFKGRAVRAEGNLVHGTLQKREQPCEYRFTMARVLCPSTSAISRRLAPFMAR